MNFVLRRKMCQLLNDIQRKMAQWMFTWRQWNSNYEIKCLWSQKHTLLCLLLWVMYSEQWLKPWNQKMLASWKKSCDQPGQHIKKQRHYFANKGLSNQTYGFFVVKYGSESWTIKKAECRWIDAFELWCWRKLLSVPWLARANQSILKEINP